MKLLLDDDLQVLHWFDDVAEVEVYREAPEVGKRLALLMVDADFCAHQVELELLLDFIEGLARLLLLLKRLERVEDRAVALVAFTPLTDQMRHSVVALLTSVYYRTVLSAQHALLACDDRAIKLVGDPDRILTDFLVCNRFLLVDQMLEGFDVLMLLHIEAVLPL